MDMSMDMSIDLSMDIHIHGNPGNNLFLLFFKV